MKTHTRRTFALLFPALGTAQQRAPVPAAAERLPSKAYPFEELKAQPNGGMTSYPILKGVTHSGFQVDMHETELAPGGVPHPPHSHVHEEMLIIREGAVDLIQGAGTTRLGPGSCAYIASGDLHGYRNSGTVPARYFVLALGAD